MQDRRLYRCKDLTANLFQPRLSTEQTIEIIRRQSHPALHNRLRVSFKLALDPVKQFFLKIMILAESRP